MKGFLQQEDDKWCVLQKTGKFEGEYLYKQLPLHPDSVSNLQQLGCLFDNLEVEFEIVDIWENGEVGINGLRYAKLITKQKESSNWDKIMNEYYIWASKTMDINPFVSINLRKYLEDNYNLPEKLLKN